MGLLIAFGEFFGVIAVLYLVLVAVGTILSLRPVRVYQYVSPGMLGYGQEEVSFTTDDGLSLKGWWTEGPSDVVVIGVHGYVMNRCEWVPTLTFLGEHGISTLYFDLRGHGKSEGTKVTFGKDEALDVRAALIWALEKAPGKKIVLLGSSMGAVSSVFATAGLDEGHPVEALILDGAYRTLDEAMMGWWPFLGGKRLGVFMRPSHWIAPMVLGFSPKEVRVDKAMESISDRPMLLLYGGADPLIPDGAVKTMTKAAGDKGSVHVFPDATHGAGRLHYPEQFRDLVKEFLERWGLLPPLQQK